MTGGADGPGGTRPERARPWAIISRPARVAHSVEQLTRNEQVAGSIPASGSSSSDSALSSALLVPAYFGPWESAVWDLVIAARPSVVVINPASGPGDIPHADYRDIVGRLDAVGSTVLGYVTTAYLAKPLQRCRMESESHRDWYGVHGIFWDEIPAERARGRVATLRSLRSWSGAGHGVRCVFNPGRPVSRSWFRSLPDSVFVTFEGPASAYGQARVIGPPERQCHLVHTVTEADPVSPPLGLGFAYLTTDLPPNPWDVFA